MGAAILAIIGGPFGVEAPALRLSLRLDLPGALMLAAASLLWIVVSAATFSGEERRPNERFAVSWLLTMAGSLGVFVAADLLTFYLVYALVSIPAYELIVRDGAPSSKRAGGVYMAFTILGEALLLLAFALLAAGEPSGSLRIEDVVAALPASPWRDGALALLIAGFGMKMALAPLNGWMPLTYTAAPIPAAAVLSGAAVKAGVIGLIRFLPFGAPLQGWGEALAVIGFCLRVLRRRHRDHAAESEDRARLFEHQPDGRDRRGRSAWRWLPATPARPPTSPFTPPIMCW